MIEGFTAWPAPAKLNLFLHVVGRRADGYHELQTVFQLLDWGDTVRIRVRTDGQIQRIHEFDGVPQEFDLVVRAARALQAASGTTLGADLCLDKQIPIGGGLGGGSSDAATTLVALNRLWQTGFSLEQLASLGLKLGADVPVFVHGRSAFAEGVGEQLQAVPLGETWYLIVQPPVLVSTPEIFASPQLTRNTPPVKIEDFASSSFLRNDLEPVARQLHPKVAQALDWLGRFGAAKMSGSGACGFVAMGSAEDAINAARMECPVGRLIAARGVDVSPLHQRLVEAK